MIIKEYDLSEGIVSDEKLGKWFGEAGFGTATIITRENVDGVAVIHVANSRYSMQINSRCNLFTCMGVNIGADTWGVIHPENEVQLMEELFNSQWCDTKTDPPEIRDEVILKLSNRDIVHARCLGMRFSKNTVYFGGASRHYDVNLVSCWMPADNVVL